MIPRLEAFVLQADEVIPCNAAIGSMWSPSGINMENLVAEADRRMYEVKRKMKE